MPSAPVPPYASHEPPAPDGEPARRAGGPPADGTPAEGPVFGTAKPGWGSAPPVAAETSRFRRPDRPAPEPALRGATPPPTDAEAFDSALAPAPGGNGPTGLSPTARDLAAPLAALAAAFQANAEALRRSHELQADLGKALQRADRSEALVQNTGALNDTFKGLTQVQRSLIQQVEESGRATRANRWLLPALVLGALVVVGAGLWLVVTRLEEVESDSIGRGDFASQLTAARREGEAAARTALEETLAAERRAAEARLREREEDLRAAKADAAAAVARAKQLETELATASAEIQGARNDSLRARALEGELIQLRADAAVKGPEAERLRLEVEAERRTVADLRRRLADVSLGRVPSAEEPDAAASRPPPPKDDPDAVKDRRVLENARSRLNEVLQTGAAGRTDSIQVTGIGSVSGLRLSDVSAVRFGPAGKVMNSYKAKDLRITVDRTRRVVEFVFADGSLEYGGSSLPFPGGSMTIVVAEGDQIAPWLASGLTFVGAK